MPPKRLSPATKRVLEKRKRDKAAGRMRREYIATEAEHKILKQTLGALRGATK